MRVRRQVDWSTISAERKAIPEGNVHLATSCKTNNLQETDVILQTTKCRNSVLEGNRDSGTRANNQQCVLIRQFFEILGTITFNVFGSKYSENTSIRVLK